MRYGNPGKINPRKNGPHWRWEIGKLWCMCVCVCVWNLGMRSIYENPKLDKKASWTPSVFYSLVDVGSSNNLFVCVVESVD